MVLLELGKGLVSRNLLQSVRMLAWLRCLMKSEQLCGTARHLRGRRVCSCLMHNLCHLLLSNLLLGPAVAESLVVRDLAILLGPMHLSWALLENFR